MQARQNEEYEEIKLHGAEGAKALYQTLTDANEKTIAIGYLIRQQENGLDPDEEMWLSDYLKDHPEMEKAHG